MWIDASTQRRLRLEHLPDRLILELRMPMRLGVGDRPIQQPGVKLWSPSPAAAGKNRSRTSRDRFRPGPIATKMMTEVKRPKARQAPRRR